MQDGVSLASILSRLGPERISVVLGTRPGVLLPRNSIRPGGCAMKLFFALFVMTLLQLAGAADVSLDTSKLPPAVTTGSALRIWVDQIGYRPNARKIVILASDKEIPASPAIELCDAHTQAAAWS